MNQAVTTAAPRDAGDIMESVIVKGDLAKLTPAERSHYYVEVCRSVGLNPLTKPFEYITLNGKLTLYALRGCTDQLRSIHKVSVVDMAESEREGVYVVTAKVQNAEGRTDIAKGAVTINGLKGDALANAVMKAETKAKRRATLSICGLGFLDETEVETIPNGRRAPQVAPLELAAPTNGHDPDTGEVGPREIALRENGGHVNWIEFGQALIAGVQSAETADEADEWLALNDVSIKRMETIAPKAYVRLGAAIDKHRATLKPAKLRLSDEDSADLRKALIQKLGKCNDAAAIDKWQVDTAEGIASLTDGDRQIVSEAEMTRRGAFEDEPPDSAAFEG